MFKGAAKYAATGCKEEEEPPHVTQQKRGIQNWAHDMLAALLPPETSRTEDLR